MMKRAHSAAAKTLRSVIARNCCDKLISLFPFYSALLYGVRRVRIRIRSRRGKKPRMEVEGDALAPDWRESKLRDPACFIAC